MKFIDEAMVTVQAGRGGDGLASFHRAPFIPKGGPDGGDGGRGGDVILESSAHISTLDEASLTPFIRAEDGQPGRKARKTGRSGKSVVLKVPVGTLVIDADSGDLLADLDSDGVRFIAAKGGRGGRGNCHFATSINRAPRKFTVGKPGEVRSLRLELKLIADVGIVGKPNAGKSTLLTALTNARQRVADYPFTTLSPALGVIFGADWRRLILADLPGLIEGAAEGRGLGYRFLRHIERTRLIIILIESTEPNYRAAYKQLTAELTAYSDLLAELPQLIVMSKSDLLPDISRRGRFKFDHRISSLTGEGLPELIEMLFERLSQTEAERPVEAG